MIKLLRQFFLIVVFVVPVFVLAHGSGQTLSKTVGEYEVDVDIDAPVLIAGEAVKFNFDLLKRSEVVGQRDFTDVWVSITPQNDSNSFFSGVIARSGFNGPEITYVFPNAGVYELRVRFNNADASVTEGVSFPLTVEGNLNEAAENPWRSGAVFGFSGFILGILITWFVKKKKTL